MREANGTPTSTPIKTGGHVAVVDVLRSFLCLMVVAHHVLFYLYAAHPTFTPPWAASEGWRFVAFCALPAVDVFFLLSGFFSVRSLFNQKALSINEIAVRVLQRCFRFWPALLALVALAIIRSDPRYIENGSVDWHRVIATFSTKTYGGFYDWFDMTTTPAWSSMVELHWAVLVLPLVSLSRRMPWVPCEAIFLLAGLCSAFLRWIKIHKHDLSCAQFCYNDTSVLFLLDERARPTGDKSPTLGSVFGLSPLQSGSTGCDECSMDSSEYSSYFAALYQHTEFRLAPHFVGAALAAFQSKKERLRQRPPYIIVLAAFIWTLERHQLPGVSSSVGIACLFPHDFIFAFGNFLDAIAWAVLLHAAATNQSRWLEDFSSNPVFKVGSRLSFGIYMFHWPIMMDLVAMIKRHGVFTQDTSPGLALTLLLVITFSLSGVFALAFEHVQLAVQQFFFPKQRMKLA
jgi:peptidoglycan/LPS O-acetylase OafA/YrhL